jgi:Zn finger protein HypA/HybF involved in hydrogenase expression
MTDLEIKIRKMTEICKTSAGKRACQHPAFRKWCPECNKHEARVAKEFKKNGFNLAKPF